jgi:hypothetical protein
VPQPIRSITGYNAQGQATSRYIQYADHFDMLVTFDGQQHVETYLGQLQDYAPIVAHAPGALARLIDQARQAGIEDQAQRLEQVLRDLPSMPLETQILEALNMATLVALLQKSTP